MKDAVAAYLALRRTAGFAMANAEYLLDGFARFAAGRNETHVRTQTAIDWAAAGASAARRDERLKAVCRFARHIRIEDDRHELPPANYFGCRKTRRMPYIYSSNEIGRLLEAAGRLRPRGAIRAHTRRRKESPIGPDQTVMAGEACHRPWASGPAIHDFSACISKVVDAVRSLASGA